MDEQKLQADEMRTTLLQQLDNGEADMHRLTAKEAEIDALRKQASSDVSKTRKIVILILVLLFPATFVALFGGIALALVITSVFGITEGSPQEESVQMFCVVGNIVLMSVIAMGIYFWRVFGNQKKQRKLREQITALEQECDGLRDAESLCFLPVEYRNAAVWSQLRQAAESNSETMQSVLERYQKKMKTDAFITEAGSIAVDVAGLVLEMLSEIV